MSATSGLLCLEGVSKRFVGVQALADVDFELEAGEIHALLGENGAGKSTLVKVMTGAYPLDAGNFKLAGKALRPESTADAGRLGISAVYQEVNLLGNLSVAHNLFLGREPKRFGCIHWAEIHAESKRLLERFGLDIDVQRKLSTYSIAVQQLVAIARGVACSASVLVLDEPTTSLDSREVEVLFRVLKDLKHQGIGIVFVTHFIDQVYAVSDRITVLRNGRRAGTWSTATLGRSELIAQMLGKELQAVEEEAGQGGTGDRQTPVVELSSLATDNGLEAVSLSARSGEAVGLAGLLGSGRTELCEALFGLARRTGGSLRIFGAEFEIESPAVAIAAGLALCPEDRRAAGIVAGLSVRENIVLARQARLPWWRRIADVEQRRMTDDAIDELGIVCPRADTAVEFLSGGNQQKVILARWLSNRPKVLVLDEPTRGIDIGAHAEIIRLIRRLRDQGLTVIVASSELDELIAFSDTIVVLRSGKTVAEFRGPGISEQAIVTALAGSE